MVITDRLRSKIERRARRAWAIREEGGTKRIHRITDVTEDTLRYRLRHKPGRGVYTGRKVKVRRLEDGTIQVPAKPDPSDPVLDLRTKYDVNDLEDHYGRVRAYKATKKDGQGWHQGGIVYKVGESFEVQNACTDKKQDCAAGINLASLDWCEEQKPKPDGRVFACEFDAPDDLACVPTSHAGKFRVHRCDVVEELGVKQDPDPVDDTPLDEPKKGFLKKLLGDKDD